MKTTDLLGGEAGSSSIWTGLQGRPMLLDAYPGVQS